MTSQTTQNYSYGTSIRQGPIEYSDPPTTTPFQVQNPPNARTAPSGFLGPYPSSTGLPATYTYQPTPVGPVAPPLYNTNTTPSGWHAPGGIPRQYQNQTVQTTPHYFQGNYDEPNTRTANLGFQSQYETPYGTEAAQSYFGSQSNVPATSMARARAQYPSRLQSISNWSSEDDSSAPTRPMASSGPPQEYRAPIRETTTSEYQKEYLRPGGQASPSGFGVNVTTTNRSNYFPGAPRPRPQSMYVSYGPGEDSGVPSSQIGGSASFEGDSDSEIAIEMSNSTIRDQSIRQPLGMLFRSRMSCPILILSSLPKSRTPKLSRSGLSRDPITQFGRTEP